MQDLRIRVAKKEDAALVLAFIRGIADYEKMSDQVIATVESLEEYVFDRGAAGVFIAEYQGEPAGFALFFENFSTFIGRTGLYLEDLFVYPAFRGRHIGKALFLEVVKEAQRRGCKRLEWTCLNWNTPSIAFYKRMGAVPMDDWTTYRLTDEAMRALIK
nr:GNAT family N-acetyltransferase [Maliibacterium massiliense]